jgi:GNAT superfamily N-acetyltransferase
MATETNIRSGTMGDCPLACELLREIDGQHARMRPDVFQPFVDSAQQRDRITRFVDQDDAEMLVAEIDSELVGLATVRVSTYPEAPMFRAGSRVCLDDLVVRSEFRGRGIAAILVDRAAEWAQSRKIPSLVINVWNENEGGLAFFTENGFEPRCQQMELRIDNTT